MGNKVLGVAILGAYGALVLWAMTKPKTAPAPTPTPKPAPSVWPAEWSSALLSLGYPAGGSPLTGTDVLTQNPSTGEQAWVPIEALHSWIYGGGGWIIKPYPYPT